MTLILCTVQRILHGYFKTVRSIVIQTREFSSGQVVKNKTEVKFRFVFANASKLFLIEESLELVQQPLFYQALRD